MVFSFSLDFYIQVNVVCFSIKLKHGPCNKVDDVLIDGCYMLQLESVRHKTGSGTASDRYCTSLAIGQCTVLNAPDWSIDQQLRLSKFHSQVKDRFNSQ